VSCRAILSAWQANPSLSFPSPYDQFGAELRRLSADPGAARLVDGIVLRILRGDDVSTIGAWARTFAARRGLGLPASFPR